MDTDVTATTAIELHIVDLGCTCCADLVLEAVRATAGVVGAELDYRSGALNVQMTTASR